MFVSIVFNYQTLNRSYCIFSFVQKNKPRTIPEQFILGYDTHSRGLRSLSKYAPTVKLKNRASTSLKHFFMSATLMAMDYFLQPHIYFWWHWIIRQMHDTDMQSIKTVDTDVYSLDQIPQRWIVEVLNTWRWSFHEFWTSLVIHSIQ